MKEKLGYKLLNREGVDAWVRSLIIDNEKGSEVQRQLLELTRANDPDTFVSAVESEVQRAINSSSPYCGGEELPCLEDGGGKPVFAMTAGHMYLMPSRDIMSIYEHWKDIPIGVAADPQFWGAVTLSEIRNNRILPAWLAVDRRGCEDCAIEQLDRAIANCDEADSKLADRMVRRILRWLMGPGHMRGAPELYGNCSLAKAWWCGYVSFESAKVIHGVDFTIKEAIYEFQAFKSIWLEFADWLSGRMRVICEPSVLGGIAIWVENSSEDSEKERMVLISRSEVQQVILRLGQISSWRVLGLDSPQDIYAMIKESFVE